MRLVLIALFLHSSYVFSGEKIVDQQNDNFISHGYSENASKELAKSEACNSAKKELLAFVFGAAFQLNQTMVRSLGVTEYSQDISMNTGEIVLRAAMTETNQNDGVTKCTITYPVLEANIEKERLKSTQNNRNIRFAEIGDPNNLKGGVLEIVTIPEDTDVFIDNVRWGTTPLKLYGKLNIGSHTLRLENPNYKVVEEKIEIGNASKTRIDKILKRATAKLQIITDPEGATVKINEEEFGHSPTNEIELLAGQKLKIEVSHPETETNVQYVTLFRDEVKKLNQKLLLKPGFISLNVNPNKDVVIRIDGELKKYSTGNSWIQVEAGTHEVSVSAIDYAEKIINIEVRGGEKQAVPTIDLISLDEILKKKAEEDKIAREEEFKRQEAQRKIEEEEELERNNKLTSTHLLLGIESNFKTPKYNSTSYGFFLGIQKSFLYNYLGLQILGSAGSEDGSNSGSSSGSNYQTIALGLPIYLGNFYLNSSYGIRFDQLRVSNPAYNPNRVYSNSDSTKEIKTKQIFTYYGAGIIFPKNNIPSEGSVYLEGGIDKYKGSQGQDTVVKFGYRWNFK